jgi:subtilase family serine protease
MSKQLTMKVVQEDVKKYKEQVEFTVNAQGDEFTVKFYPYFSPAKIKSLVENLIQFFQSANKEKLNVPDEEFDDLISYFIIRTFTNIKMTTSKKAEKIYEEFKVAINSELIGLILSSFPEESVLAVHKRIYDTIELSAKLENKLKAIKDEIKDLPLENKEVLFGKEKQVPEV